MTEPPTRQGLPWGALLWSGLLTVVLLSLYRTHPDPDGPLPWKSTWAPVGAGVAAFLVLRWLQNATWGLLAGLLLPLHPLYLHAARQSDLALVAPALVLAVLACTVAGWRLTFGPRFGRHEWWPVAVIIPIATGLLWPLHPRSGLVATVLASGGLLAGAVLATRLYRRHSPGGPAGHNIVMALLVAIVSPAAGLVLAPASVRYVNWQNRVSMDADLMDLVQAGIDTNLEEYHWQGFSAAETQRWGWPAVGLAGILMVWGFWRSIRRGWRLWVRRRPPIAWLLTGYVVLVFFAACLHSADSDMPSLLTLATLAVLLAVFGVADLVRGFMERLVLAPPQERD